MLGHLLRTAARLPLRWKVAIALAAGATGVLLFAMLIIVVDVGASLDSAAGGPNWLCHLYEGPALDAAIARGLEVNAGCCDEHMLGECRFPRPNSTLLVHAIESRRPDAVDPLLARGAQVNLGLEYGLPLGVAAATGQSAIVEKLLARGVSVESRDVGLRMAAHHGEVDIAQRILAPTSADQRAAACAALECALVPELDQRGRPELPRQRELLRWAISNCPDPNLRCEGEHLLTSVARNDDNAPLVKTLLARGVDLTAPERNGRNVLQYLRGFSDYSSRPRIKALLDSPPR